MNPSHGHYWVYNQAKECIDKYMMSKEETGRYLEDQRGIARHDTYLAWDLLEQENPGFFISYNARIHERNARTRERVASTSPRERSSAILGEQEQQQRLSPPRGLRILLPDLNVPASSIQEAIAVHPSTQAGPSRAANANVVENQNLQASLQQPVIPNEFCQQVLNTLGQLLNTLDQLQSNSDHMMKLLTDGHGFGPHPFAAGSSKRQRVGEAEVRGGNEETAKLQEEEEGNGGEAEKQQEKEEGKDEEAEKQQENEEGNIEEK